jgi:hypothetical protein
MQNKLKEWEETVSVKDKKARVEQHVPSLLPYNYLGL